MFWLNFLSIFVSFFMCTNHPSWVSGGQYYFYSTYMVYDDSHLVDNDYYDLDESPSVINSSHQIDYGQTSVSYGDPYISMSFYSQSLENVDFSTIVSRYNIYYYSNKYGDNSDMLFFTHKYLDSNHHLHFEIGLFQPLNVITTFYYKTSNTNVVWFDVNFVDCLNHDYTYYDNGVHRTIFNKSFYLLDYYSVYFGNNQAFASLGAYYSYVNTNPIYGDSLDFRYVPLDVSVGNDIISNANQFDEGYSLGYSRGTADLDTATDTAFQNGVNEGWRQAGANTYTFGRLFGAIADTPIMILRNLLGFEIFGVDAMAILMSMLTGCIAIFLIRKIIF